MLARERRYHAAQCLNFLFSQQRTGKHITKTTHDEWLFFFGFEKPRINELGFNMIVKPIKFVLGGWRRESLRRKFYLRAERSDSEVEAGDYMTANRRPLLLITGHLPSAVNPYYNHLMTQLNSFLKLTPAYRDYIWGGEKLRPRGDQFLRRNRTLADQHLLKPTVGPAMLSSDTDPGI